VPKGNSRSGLLLFEHQDERNKERVNQTTEGSLLFGATSRAVHHQEVPCTVVLWLKRESNSALEDA